MQSKTKITKFYSRPLMKQNIKSNWVLLLVICIVFCMMTTVTSFAISILGDNDGKGSATEEEQKAQEDFYSHLFAIHTYNQMSGGTLSPEDFMQTEDRTAYDTVFAMMNQQLGDNRFSTESFAHCIELLKDEDGSVESYVKQFEYVCVLNNQKGVFSGEDLSVDRMMETVLSSMDIPIERLAEMDSTSMLSRMYFTVIGLLPTFLFIVIVGNSLIANQVDNGSMAYVLSTPTKRSAVANTQAVFLIVSPVFLCAVACIVRIVALKKFTGDVDVKMNIALYAGMYLLIEAVGGICYMGSCLFSQSRRANAFGGGIAVWFFLASLLGMFGTDNMVDMGVGVEGLSIFNKLTLVGFYDVDALFTIGSDNVDYGFVWKFCVLAGIAVATYIIGKLRFQKKDLPL